MLNRTLCDVLGEMRKCYKSRNFSYLPGLIEEAQTMGNRMEGKLWDQKDLERLRDEAKELKEEIKALESKKKKLEDGQE
jgi:hypothetical protein